MKVIRAVLEYIRIVHIILLLVIALFIFYFIWPEYDQTIAVSLPAAKTVVVSTVPEKPAEQNMPGIMEYVIIADKNLFHPERVIPVEKKQKQPEPKPEIVLYGTILSDKGNMAYIEDKKHEYAPPPAGGKGTGQ